MEDVVVRSRYPRYNTLGRRRRKYTGDSGSLPALILKQALLAAVLLLVIVGVKSVNSPVTNYLTGKIQSVLFARIEAASIYEGIDRIVNSIRGSIPKKTQDNKAADLEKTAAAAETAPAEASTRVAETEEEGFDQQAVAVSGNVTFEDSEERLEEEIKARYSFKVPVEGVLTSPFGERTDPVSKAVKVHEGIDIAAKNGASVKAALDGEVIEAGSLPTYGRYIKIRHSDNITTVYAHCSELVAAKGKKVVKGETIAKVGNTGLSVGVHLHFEIWKDGKPLNPTRFIDIQLE